MITEIAQIDVEPGQEAEFEAAVKKATPVFKRTKGCQGMELRRSIEKPSRYRLLVNWETLEDHTVGFRNSPEFQEWRGARRPVLRVAARGRARATSRARLLSRRRIRRCA
jgi:heme-degrading monooxygenase HmoA